MNYLKIFVIEIPLHSGGVYTVRQRPLLELLPRVIGLAQLAQDNLEVCGLHQLKGKILFYIIFVNTQRTKQFDSHFG